MASLRSVSFSIVTGGAICVAGVALCIPLLPAFWRYRPSASEGEPGSALAQTGDGA
jgi:hypothetical protein